jgi:hypothetical protein
MLLQRLTRLHNDLVFDLLQILEILQIIRVIIGAVWGLLTTGIL